MINLKQLTQSENLVIQGVISILVSALIGSGSAGVQYATRGGHVDIGVLFSIIIASFGLKFGSSLASYVPAHAKDLINTYYDAANQAQSEVARLREQVAQTQSMQSALQEIKAQQAAAPTTVAQQVAAKLSDNLQQIVAQQLPIPAPVETAANPLQGTDFASLLAVTNPQTPVVTASK